MTRNSKQNALNEEQRDLLISKCKKQKEKLVIKTLIYTGLRASELCSMERGWIDWQSNTINVSMWEGKTKKHNRKIPLLPQAREILEDWFDKHTEINMCRATIYNIVKRVAKRIEGPFPSIYPHALRATFASLMAKRGLTAPTLMEIMGWKKLETANNYVKSFGAIEEFNKKMRGVK